MLLNMKMENDKFEIDIDSESESSEGDEYEANIEFSNACRNYYLSRLEATESFKMGLKRGDTEKTVESHSHQRRSNTIDDKMEKLRAEMASLMDQDVSLMEQLLTLNETINEIKQGRLSSSSKGSVSSRGFVSGSDWSVVSETEIPVTQEEKSHPEIPGFIKNPQICEYSSDKIKVNNNIAKDKETKIHPSDLWKVRTQLSVMSNDSGFVEDLSGQIQTEV